MTKHTRDLERLLAMRATDRRKTSRRFVKRMGALENTLRSWPFGFHSINIERMAGDEESQGTGATGTEMKEQ
jgi:hypothetical protein